MLFVGLLQLISACSFTSSSTEEKTFPLDHNDLPSKNDVLRELQASLFPMGIPLTVIPELEAVTGWMRKVRESKEYDAKIARFMWLEGMGLKGFDKDEEVKKFLWFAIDEHNDLMLIEDYVNYRPNLRFFDDPEDWYIHLQYLQRYRLRHQRHLPTDLIESAEKLDDKQLRWLTYRNFSTLLLSRHPKDHAIFRTDNRFDSPCPHALRVALYARMFYGFEPLGLVSRLWNNVAMIPILNEFSNKYVKSDGRTFDAWLADQPESTKAIAALLLSGKDLPEEEWMEQVKGFIHDNDWLGADQMTDLMGDSLFPSLLHHLLNNKSEWMSTRIYGIPQNLLSTYLTIYSEDYPLMPTPMPPISALIPRQDRYPVSMAPMFTHLVKIYGSMGLEQAIRTYNMMNQGFPFSNKVLACIRLVDPAFYLHFGGKNAKLNNNLLVVVHKISNVLSPDEQYGWLLYFMRLNQPPWNVETTPKIEEQ